MEYRCYSNKTIIVLRYPKLYLNIQKDDPRVILKAFYTINDENQKKYFFENFKILGMISFLALEERKRLIIISKDLIDIFDYIAFNKSKNLDSLENLIKNEIMCIFPDEVKISLIQIYIYEKIKLTEYSKNILKQFQDIKDILNFKNFLFLNYLKNSLEPPVKVKLEEIYNKLQDKLKSKNVENKTFNQNINRKELIEFFDSTLDEEDIKDFKSNDQAFKNYLIPLIKSYHQSVFARTDFENRLDKLKILSSIKEDKIDAKIKRSNYRKFFLLNK